MDGLTIYNNDEERILRRIGGAVVVLGKTSPSCSKVASFNKQRPRGIGFALFN